MNCYKFNFMCAAVRKVVFIENLALVKRLPTDYHVPENTRLHDQLRIPLIESERSHVNVT